MADASSVRMDPDDANPSAGIAVRRVAADDPVLMLVRDLCYETLHRPFGVSRDDAWNESDPASSHYVAMYGDKLAGYVRVIIESDSAQIRQVVVDPAYRNRGVASMLVSSAVSRARELNARRAFLHARIRAIGVYERLGFRVTEGPFRMGRTFLAHVRMELPLR